MVIQNTGRRRFLQTMTSITTASTLACESNDGAGGILEGSGGSSGALPSSGGTGTGGVSVAGGVSMAGGTAPMTGGVAGGPGGSEGGHTPQGSGEASGGKDGSGPPQPTSPQGSGGASGGKEGSGPPQLTSPLGVALLGLGAYANGQLAPALQLTEHCRLKGIVTGTPSKIPDWQARFGIEDKNVYSYETMGALIENPDIHVVYVVTPNHVHAQFAIAAARAKKHVWLEKPMAMTPEECQRIIDACNENGVKLSIGYRMQHEPNTRTVIGYASSKPYGAIRELQALAGFSGFGNRDRDVWRLKRETGGGALYDMGVYSINAARYATGEEPVRVRSARQWTERPELFTEVDEWTEFELEFPSGVIAHCRTSFGENLNRLEVVCEAGSYWLEPLQSYRGVQGQTSDGVLLNLPIQNQQARQMDDDALAILGQGPLLVPGEEGLRDVRIVQAIQESARTGQPVEL